MGNKVSFIVDGFNLYHSVKQAGSDLKKPTKWLNIKKLCSSYLPHIGKDAALKSIYYFTALAEHLEAKNPDVTKRHKAFLKVIDDQGIFIEINRFKKKNVYCPFCRRTITKYEEKETDVAISIKLIELFAKDECDTAIIVSGDTDIAPAVRTANHLYLEKKVLFAFPYKRKNKELSKLCPKSFYIKKERYANCQLDDPYHLSDGSIVKKPASW